MCSPRKSNENFLIFTFYESKQMSLTQDLRWSLGRSIALQLQRQTDLLLCTINCFLQWDHLPNMAVGDLAFYYTLYLCLFYTLILDQISRNLERLFLSTFYIQHIPTWWCPHFLQFISPPSCITGNQPTEKRKPGWPKTSRREVIQKDISKMDLGWTVGSRLCGGISLVWQLVQLYDPVQ